MTDTKISSIIIFKQQILVLYIAVFFNSCSNQATIEESLISDLPKFEQSSNEIIIALDSFDINDNSIKKITNTTLYSRDLKNGSNIIERQINSFQKTNKLVSDKLLNSIFIQQDSTICFETHTNKPTLTKFYRHFLCFSHSGKQIQLDIGHRYKMIQEKRIKEGWSYLIVEQGFD